MKLGTLCYLTVEDQIEPAAACDDELNVSIGGGDVHEGVYGGARIFAVDVNEGSGDNCSTVTLEVRIGFKRIVMQVEIVGVHGANTLIFTAAILMLKSNWNYV